jgi:hypothetical protein
VLLTFLLSRPSDKEIIAGIAEKVKMGDDKSAN